MLDGQLQGSLLVALGSYQAAFADQERALELARTYGSAKYQALALARLGRRPEAAELAGACGSDYLLAQVAPPAQARAASERIAAGLPAELRLSFLENGYLARA